MRSYVLCILLAAASLAAAQESRTRRLPNLRVSDNRRFLVTDQGKPFFYLADTAWELFHRLDRKQADEYLAIRASQGFTAIQAVALAEEGGLTIPNANGDLPFEGKDPSKPVKRYWDHVEYIVDRANAHGLYIAMLPTWGSWVKDEPVITAANAAPYGEFLAKRFSRKGVIWILGGDRPATGFEETWRALARGITAGSAGKPLISFHPKGGGTSSTSFHSDEWLGFNMQQNGHSPGGERMTWARIAADYERTPVKPVVDGEPLYEDHPLSFKAKEFGYSLDAHVRQYAYWDVFSGAAGHTYGNHAVWQFYSSERKPVNGPLMYWTDAVKRPGAIEMQYLRRLIESRSYLTRVPDQTMVVDALTGADHIVATRGEGYAFVYSPQGRKFSLHMGVIQGSSVKASWFNPRTGTILSTGSLPNNGDKEFVCPSEGFGSDWVLVLDSAK